MAISSCVTSPFCTWLVAACMSVTCDRDKHHLMSPQSPVSCKRLSRWTRRRRLLSKCGAAANSQGGLSGFNGGLLSSFCGSTIQGLMASCLAFEPCNEYYNSKGISSLGFFGDNAFSSLFGSKNVTLNRKQRRLNRAIHSGIFPLLFFYFAKYYMSFQ